MKYNFIRIALVLLIVTVLVTMGFLKKPPVEPRKSSGKGFAVVELFTSEGCSSCPAADAEVEKISKAYPTNVYVLGFHVDYWNRLGWKDPFSDAAYSSRQRAYAGQFKLDGVYTPQVVVNGKQQMVGSDAPLLEKTVSTEISDIANHAIELSAGNTGGQTVQVKYTASVQPDAVVQIALVQMAAQTDVKRGENEGRVLHHVNIVRDFKTVAAPGSNRTEDLSMPAGTTAKDYKIILYTQQKTTGEITAVAACPVK